MWVPPTAHMEISTIIHLIKIPRQDFPDMRVGPEPTTDKYFSFVSPCHLFHNCCLPQVHHCMPRLLQCCGSGPRPRDGFREAVCTACQVWVFLPQQVQRGAESSYLPLTNIGDTFSPTDCSCQRVLLLFCRAFLLSTLLGSSGL